MQRWEKDTRYYEAHLHQDLWGGLVGIGDPPGTVPRKSPPPHSLAAS